GRQIETRRAERALDTLASYEQQQWMARAIGAEAAEERMLAEHIRRTTTEGDGQTNRGIFMVMGPDPTEGFSAEHNEARRGDSPKSVIRSAPGLPADYMMVRKDYLTELHRTRAQAMAEYRRLCEKYASAMRELHYFQQERQQGVVRLRRIEGTLPADDLRRAFADGAAWWEFHSQGFTMFNSDRREAEAEAEARFPNGKPGPVEVLP
ncbi:MAG: hypothetical protein KAX65_06300, partial [Caldilineaceae bacterium]|nr:hypothetical protein [Caldilineaceae bacterium]